MIMLLLTTGEIARPLVPRADAEPSCHRTGQRTGQRREHRSPGRPPSPRFRGADGPGLAGHLLPGSRPTGPAARRRYVFPATEQPDEGHCQPHVEVTDHYYAPVATLEASLPAHRLACRSSDAPRIWVTSTRSRMSSPARFPGPCRPRISQEVGRSPGGRSPARAFRHCIDMSIRR